MVERELEGETVVDREGRLQNVQNHAAKVVFCNCRHEHVRPLLKALHWLPVKERIILRIASTVFQFFDGTLPPYLSSCVCLCVCVCGCGGSEG